LLIWIISVRDHYFLRRLAVHLTLSPRVRTWRDGARESIDVEVVA
jgi:hypothetical protein